MGMLPKIRIVSSDATDAYGIAVTRDSSEEVFLVPFRHEQIVFAEQINDAEALVVAESKASKAEIVVARVNTRSGAFVRVANVEAKHVKQFLISSDLQSLYLLLGLPTFVRIDLTTMTVMKPADLIVWGKDTGSLGHSREYFEIKDGKRVFRDDVNEDGFNEDVRAGTIQFLHGLQAPIHDLGESWLSADFDQNHLNSGDKDLIRLRINAENGTVTRANPVDGKATLRRSSDALHWGQFDGDFDMFADKVSTVDVALKDVTDSNITQCFVDLGQDFVSDLNALRLGTELKLRFIIDKGPLNGTFSEQQFFKMMEEKKPAEATVQALKKMIDSYVASLKMLPDKGNLWSDTEGGMSSLCHAVRALAILHPDPLKTVREYIDALDTEHMSFGVDTVVEGYLRNCELKNIDDLELGIYCQIQTSHHDWNKFGLIEEASKLVSPRVFYKLAAAQVHYSLSPSGPLDPSQEEYRVYLLTKLHKSLQNLEGDFAKNLAQILETELPPRSE